MDLSEIWSKIRNDKSIWKKLGVLLGLFMLTAVISLIIQVVSSLSSYIAPFFPDDSFLIFQLSLNLGLPLMIQALIFPVHLYLQGYKLEMVKTGEVPIHGNYMERVKSGFKYALGIFTVNFVVGLLAVTFIGMIVLLLSVLFQGESWIFAISLTSGILVIVFALLIVYTIINALVTPAMMFVYLNKGTLKEMFDMSAIRSILRKCWKDLLLVVLINYLLNTVLGIAGFILCFLGPLTMGAVQAVKLILNALLLSQIYRKVREPDYAKASSD